MGVFARLIAAIAVPVVVLSLVLGASVLERHDDARIEEREFAAAGGEPVERDAGYRLRN